MSETNEANVAKQLDTALRENPLTEGECYLLEHALQIGFEYLDSETTVFLCTPRQLIDLVQARKGSVEGLDVSNVIDMVLHCPSCGVQHIDRPDPPSQYAGMDGTLNEWTNPPHKSHLCRKEDGGCGHIWRPANVPTNGVQAVAPGKADSPLVPPLPADGLLVRVGANREISSSQHYRSGAIQVTTKLKIARRR